MKDDMISRQAALDALGNIDCSDGVGVSALKCDAIDDAVTAIKALPSAQPTGTNTVQVDDCISRQAAIAEIMEDLEDRSLHDDPATPEDYAEGYDEGIRNAAAIVLQMPSAQPGWIPCSERPPKVREWVLCQCRAGIMDVLRLTEDGNWNKNYPHAEYMSGFVIAWMPLPTPYREGRQDGEG